MPVDRDGHDNALVDPGRGCVVEIGVLEVEYDVHLHGGRLVLRKIGDQLD
jgi:hypothetical protein